MRPVARGEHVLTAALSTGSEPIQATPDGSGHRLDGVAEAVLALPLAARVLVPARTPDGRTLVAIVDPTAAGSEIGAGRGTNREPLGRLTLTGARIGPEALLGGAEQSDAVLRFAIERGQLGIAALTLGVAGRALRLTAKYTSERRQFDRPIATFQAVSQRAADAYVDLESLRLALWRAAWLVARGRPATREIVVAKLWSAEAGHRIVSAAQHLHGGVGFDRDYPLYRYYLWQKQMEYTLGGASEQIAALGRMIAGE